ncbi:hypothetical protein KAX02_12425 [candidate division WOR-3 bacterium]|nr:hypothetical protein [candidate division WOR-3 bacterium]
MYKSGKIKTYWRKINKYKEQIKNDYTRNKKIMRGLKVNGCAMCGYNKCDAALDFHHVNPEDRKFALGVFSMSKKDERIVEELNKCILLCCRCHREIHEVKYYKVDGE